MISAVLCTGYFYYIPSYIDKKEDIKYNIINIIQA